MKTKTLFTIVTITTLLFTSCGVMAVSPKGEVVVTTPPAFSEEVHLEDFMDLELVVAVKRKDTKADAIDYFDETWVYVDRNTDIIYLTRVGTHWGTMTPIYKVDGSLLTYSEWKASHK